MKGPLRSLPALPVLFLLYSLPSETNLTADANALKLLISVETQTITAPFPARVTLHLHNAGRQPLWLYRKARDPVAIQREARHVALDSDEHPSAYAAGGSTATVRLEPADSRNVRTPAEGTVLESVGMPHPKLVRPAPGDDYDEKAVIRLVPAMAGTEASAKPVWGRYRLSVVYRAQFLNAEEIERNLGLVVWQGEVSSNTLDLDLRPPTGQGSVAGPALGADSRPIPGILVSLSDEQERLIGQTLTDTQGRFFFSQLPFGLYWVTARRVNSPTDTMVFRHVELTSSEPAGALDLPLLPAEVYEPKQMVHKPVLFRVVDSSGHPADAVGLEITWSSGTVLDNVKVRTTEDGTAVADLIPGRNYVTLRRHGCPKEEQWVEVAAGGGIDDAKLTLECARK